MKHLLIAILILAQTKWPHEKFRIEMLNSQMEALKQIPGAPAKWNYERTFMQDRALANYALRKADSALQAHGLAEPFGDSLSVATFFMIEGYNAGMIWRDSSKIFTWIFSQKFFFKMKSMIDLTADEKKIVREGSTRTDSFFHVKGPSLGEEHGDYTSLTKWYAPPLRKKTCTYLFFTPPR